MLGNQFPHVGHQQKTRGYATGLRQAPVFAGVPLAGALGEPSDGANEGIRQL